MIMQAEVPALPLPVYTSFCVLTISSLEKAKTHSIFLCVWPTTGSVGVVSIRVGWNDFQFPCSWYQVASNSGLLRADKLDLFPGLS